MRKWLLGTALSTFLFPTLAFALEVGDRLDNHRTIAGDIIALDRPDAYMPEHPFYLREASQEQNLPPPVMAGYASPIFGGEFQRGAGSAFLVGNRVIGANQILVGNRVVGSTHR